MFMRMNRKGDIGFMEAMAGAMAVTIILAAFIGAVALKVCETEIDPGDLDVDAIVNCIFVSEDMILGDMQNELERQIIKSQINGASIKCTSVPDKHGDPTLKGELFFKSGTLNGQLSTERKLFSIDTDKGYVLINVEVKIWK
jgi:hypothetical protein